MFHFRRNIPDSSSIPGTALGWMSWLEFCSVRNFGVIQQVHLGHGISGKEKLLEQHQLWIWEILPILRFSSFTKGRMQFLNLPILGNRGEMFDLLHPFLLWYVPKRAALTHKGQPAPAACWDNFQSTGQSSCLRLSREEPQHHTALLDSPTGWLWVALWMLAGLFCVNS